MKNSTTFTILSAFTFAGATLSPAQSPSHDSDPWLRAVPGWNYEWPRDHRTHRGFRTEWWYFTGNLKSADGRRFGYQLTFFRQGIRPPNSAAASSRFVVDDLKFGHFTVTDVDAQSFLYHQRISRGAFAEAGFSESPGDQRVAWLGPWTLELDANGSFHLTAREPARALKLQLAAAKPWAIHGANGVSQKAEDPRHASHYYSGTRLRSQGQLTLHDKTIQVEGESWFDHEWATNQLAPDQAGWDWFSLQFDDGTELMLYQLRRADGSTDPASSGSFIAADGRVRHLSRNEIVMTPREHWVSPKSSAKYPLGWDLEIPSLGIQLQVSTPVKSQELLLQPITYWEGLIDARGERAGEPLRGHGYLELTGYAGPVVGLSTPRP